MYDRVLVIAILSTLIIFGLCDDPVFRRDYKYISKYNAFYKAHQTRQNWTTAVAYCVGEGSKLLIPSSKEEAEEAGALLNERASQYYVGIHDLFAEGEFVTLDGLSANDVYVNWLPGEPNNSLDVEDCVAVSKVTSGYNDENCANKEFFICKRTNSGITMNEICETTDMNYFYSLDMDRCYKFHHDPLSWQNAFRKCRSEEADLGVINSNREANIFITEFAKYPTNYSKENFDKTVIHLGFNDLILPGQFLTTDGKLISETGYANWGFNQPDNRNNVEHCGSMFRDGTLNDVDCSFRAMFICEKKLSSDLTQDLKVDGTEVKI